MAVKSNNMIPAGHFHKDWQRLIRTWFNQPAKKFRRRVKRADKAKRLAPRPLHVLRPAVRCPTVRYHTKVRLGRGFTLEELRRAGLSSKFASTIGIAVDFRRRNNSVETLLSNVQRLKEYMQKLVLFPKNNRKKLLKGEASEKERKLAIQIMTPIPLKKKVYKQRAREVTKDEMNYSCFSALRMARADVKLIGIHIRKSKEVREGEISLTERRQNKKKRN